MRWCLWRNVTKGKYIFILVDNVRRDFFPDDFVKNPPSIPKVPNFVQYYYFEKDIETLEEQNYVGWQDGDYWLDANKCENINIHPFKKGERFRK